jgi:response regulator RpfG family c-di-GMP phosphodiesterase
MAARFHDVGKIAVPDGILDESRPLTAEEWRIVRHHPTVAHDRAPAGR